MNTIYTLAKTHTAKLTQLRPKRKTKFHQKSKSKTRSYSNDTSKKPKKKSRKLLWLGLGVASFVLLVGGVKRTNQNGNLWDPVPLADTDVDMTDKVVVITGGNSGIGLETGKIISEMGGTVVLACRNMPKCNFAKNVIQGGDKSKKVECLELDLGSFDSIDEFVKDFNGRYPRLDVLINNAGVMGENNTTKDGLGSIMGINHYGMFRLTYQLLPTVLNSSGRIIIVSSEMEKMGEIDVDEIDRKSFDDNSFSGLHKIYASSKLANALFMQTLSKKLEGSGTTVNALTPGFVKTNISANFEGMSKYLMALMSLTAMDVHEGSQTHVHVATSPEVGQLNGKYFQRCKLAELGNPATYPESNMRDIIWEDALKVNNFPDFNSWKDIKN